MHFIIGVLLVVFADQVSKVWIAGTMELGESIPIINNIFHITYILNPSSAFGLLKFSNKTFIVLGSIIIVIGIFLLFKIAQENKLVFYSFILLLGGSLGNLIDRFRIGSVIDFIDFRIWPIFNIADSALNIGILLLIIHFLFKQKDENNNKELKE